MTLLPGHMRRTSRLALALVAASALTLSACGDSEDPLSSGGDDGDTVVIGSQAYYSNEIIAEIYAQALEAEDIDVDRQFQIGQREVYLPEIENGSLDLFPEYTGPLLLALDPEATATRPDEVYAALGEALVTVAAGAGAMGARSPEVLAAWREGSDPVAGLRHALVATGVAA